MLKFIDHLISWFVIYTIFFICYSLKLILKKKSLKYVGLLVLHRNCDKLFQSYCCLRSQYLMCTELKLCSHFLCP